MRSILSFLNRIAACSLLFLTLNVSAEITDSLQVTDLIGLSLQELMSIKVINSATLTPVSSHSSPSSTILITQEDIVNSGARRITDLLEIFVPNFQYVLQDAIPWQIGLRGIMSNDKQLWLVNGKNVLQRTSNGISSEFDLPSLSDIKTIEVIRGPGSALHGPGALGMVINIITFTHANFNGVEVGSRIGGIENFQTVEVKAAKTFNPDHGVFVYTGINQMQGASHTWAPMYAAREIDFQGKTYGPEEDISSMGGNYRQAYDDKPKIKFHTQYQNKGFEAWVRYVNGGELQQNFYSQEQQTGYGHLNLDLSQKFNLGKKHQLQVVAGADNLWLRRYYIDSTETIVDRSYNEYEITLKAIETWKPVKKLSLSLGASYKYELFGRKKDGIIALHGGDTIPWETSMVSVLGEINWQPVKWFQIIAGVRYDKHTYTNIMESPRVSAIFTLNRNNILRIMEARSVRLNACNDMRIDYKTKNRMSDIETLWSIEGRWDHFFSSNFQASLVGFYYYLEPLSFNSVQGYRTLGGSIESGGGELEVYWRTNKIILRGSHSYTKLLDFDKVEGAKFLHYSTSGTGYGNDFSYWNNHNSKLYFQYKITRKLLVNSSAIVLWGSEGGYNLAKTVIDPNYENRPEYYLLNDNEPFTTSVYWNIGAGFRPGKNLNIHADLYNILGLFDENLNKRWIWNGGNVAGGHRIQPFSFAISLQYLIQ